jgi:hypothetical protein
MCARRFVATLPRGTPVACRRGMPCSHPAFALSDPALDETIEALAETKRFGAFDLAYALSAMNAAEVTGEDPARPATDDDPTLELPAPTVPRGTPSPLGDELPAALW